MAAAADGSVSLVFFFLFPFSPYQMHRAAAAAAAAGDFAAVD